MELFKCITLHLGHDEIAGLLNGRVEGDGKSELLGFSSKLFYFGNNTAGRNRDVAGTYPERIGAIHKSERIKGVVVVGKRLALTHGNHVGNPCSKVSCNDSDLPEHLARRKGAGKAVLTSGAEQTFHCATSLRGETDCKAVLCGQANRLDHDAITEAEKIFAGSINGDLSLDDIGINEGIAIRELGAQR